MFTGISVVVPHFQDEHLAGCIAAIARSWHALDVSRKPRVELIVVDDASATEAPTQPLALPFHFVRLPFNLGVANARNEGAAAAKYSHVLFVDSDVFLDEHYLSSAFDSITEHLGAKVLQAPHSEVPANKPPSLFHHFMALTWFHDNISFRNNEIGTLLVSGCVIFERAFFNQIGRFSTRFRGSGGEEFEILARMPEGSILQDFRLVSYHHSDSFARRIRKVFARGQNYYEVVHKNRSFPRGYERALEMRGFLSCLMSVSVVLALVSLKTGLALYLLSVSAYVALNFSQLRFYRERHSLRLAILSLWFRQIEYSAACAALVLGVVRKKLRRFDFRFLLRNSPSYFIFWVTQNCNFTCDHCFNFLENKKRNHDLSLNEIEKLSRNLGELKYVTLAGGEPMLRRDLAEIAEILYRNNRLSVLNVVTNGWFTDRTLAFAEKVLERCPDLFLSISCSLDGLRDVHDKVRMKEGSFDQAVLTIKGLKEIARSPNGARLAVSAGGTYHAGNAAIFADTARFLSRELGIPYMMSLIRGEKVQNDLLKNVDIRHYRSTATEVARLNRDVFARGYPFRSARLALSETVADIAFQSFENGKMTAPCKAGEAAFVLTANGDVLLCEILNIRLGNVREHGLDPLKILRSPGAKREIQKIAEKKCHCTWECFQSINAVYSPRAYPIIAKHLVKGLF